MSCKIIIYKNPFEIDSFEEYQSDNLLDFIFEYYEKFPSNARIYHNFVSKQHDITPHKDDENSIFRLNELNGLFYIIHYPETGFDPLTIIAVTIGVTVIASLLFSPKIPSITSRNVRSESPNNGLGDRQNSLRINSRICDIYGTVRATPDLIALPYKIFENNREVEYSYMVLGRGYYSVIEKEILDDTTPVSYITGMTAEIYEPYTKPINNEPSLRIGEAITRPIISIASTNTVNGQTLRPPNDIIIEGNNDISFDDNIITVSNDEIAMDDYFEIGDMLQVRNAIAVDYHVDETYSAYEVEFVVESTYGWFRIPSTGEEEVQENWIVGRRLKSDDFILYNGGDPDAQGFDLSGFYEILDIEHITDGVNWFWKIQVNIYLSEDPVQYINENWVNEDLDNSFRSGASISFRIYTEDAVFYDGTYEIVNVAIDAVTVDGNPFTISISGQSSTLLVSGYHPVGSFILSKSNATSILANFVAINGLYKDNGSKQYRTDVVIALFVEQLDSEDEVIWSNTYTATVLGSNKSRTTRAVTLDTGTIPQGRYRVSAYRVTNTDTEFNGSVVDEIKWRDCYACSPVELDDFGNCTTVYVRTPATQTALAISDRKFNMLVTRKLPQRISGTDFTTELYATNRADEIISAICLDPYIGNRNISEIDFDNIYSTVAEIEEYFGTSDAIEFSYTFDNADLSFEETLALVAEAIFCKAYRQGSLIRINFEKQTDDSIILFNSMNKLPDSETRTIRFENEEQYDGVEYKWIDPDDNDTETIIYLPESYNAINPNEIESVGVRNYRQAYFHAWREWQKIQFKNVITEFNAGHEAEILITGDRILVADNTRTGTQDGEIEEQNGLILKLSSPYIFETDKNYGIWLQYYNGSTENIPIIAGSDKYHIILQYPPQMELVTDSNNYAKTTYIIVAEDNTREMAFLVSERKPNDKMTSSVTAYNYSDKYYLHDKDYINEIIN